MGTNLVNDGDVMIMHLNRLISEGIFLNPSYEACF